MKKLLQLGLMVSLLGVSQTTPALGIAHLPECSAEFDQISKMVAYKNPPKVFDGGMSFTGLKADEVTKVRIITTHDAQLNDRLQQLTTPGLHPIISGLKCQYKGILFWISAWSYHKDLFEEKEGSI